VVLVQACELLLQQLLVLDSTEVNSDKLKANRKKVIKHIQTLMTRLDEIRAMLDGMQAATIVRTAPLSPTSTQEQRQHIVSKYHSPEKIAKSKGMRLVLE
jgi:uncharacterized membrane protein YccC